MTPVLIGYFPKQTAERPDWLDVAHVQEICSVSECTGSGPDGWIDSWRHNAWWAYDTQELAWSVVPAERQTQFDLYAWRIFPVRFDHGEERALDLPALKVEPLSAHFVRLGFDAVSRSLGSCFECSPLSCNAMAGEVTVNRHCLIESEAEAFEVARDFSRAEPEPGPYYLIEVWRFVPDARPGVEQGMPLILSR